MTAHEKLLPLIFAAIAASAALASACSSSSGGSGPGSVSSVDSSKPVNSLTDSEAKQYCADANRYSEGQVAAADTKKIVCGLTAATFGAYGAKDDAEAQANCKAQYTECMNRHDEPADPDAGTNEGENEDPCADFKSQAQSCTATVGEVNQCLSDRAAALKTLAAKDYCAAAKASQPDGGAPSQEAYDDPASCKAIAAKCPTLSGASDDTGNGDGDTGNGDGDTDGG